VSGIDPVTFAGVTALLLAIGLMAGTYPQRRQPRDAGNRPDFLVQPPRSDVRVYPQSLVRQSRTQAYENGRQSGRRLPDGAR